MELEYLETGIRLAGSMREACRSIFMAPPSSIHTRIAVLKGRLTNNKGVNNEEITYNQ